MAGGRFVTFEGVEGCGKSTQVELLAAYLRERGVAVLTTREPGGTPLGEGARALALDPSMAPVPAAELFLIEAARAQLVRTVIAPALANGTFVISDRYADSSLAYQGHARDLGWDVVRTLNALATSGVTPDRTLVLDVPVDVAVGRARSRPGQNDSNRRFEDEALAFHRAVAAGYRRLAAEEPKRVTLVDAAGPPAEVFQHVLATVRELLP